MKQMYELKKLVSELWISNFFSKSSFVSTISKSAVINKLPKVAPKKKLATQLWRPLLDPPDFIISSAKLILCKKTSAFDLKNGTNNFEIKGEEYCSSQIPRVPV